MDLNSLYRIYRVRLRETSTKCESVQYYHFLLAVFMLFSMKDNNDIEFQLRLTAYIYIM